MSKKRELLGQMQEDIDRMTVNNLKRCASQGAMNRIANKELNDALLKQRQMRHDAYRQENLKRRDHAEQMYKRSISNRLISQIDSLNNYKQRCKAAEEEKKSLEKMEQ